MTDKIFHDIYHLIDVPRIIIHIIPNSTWKQRDPYLFLFSIRKALLRKEMGGKEFAWIKNGATDIKWHRQNPFFELY